MITTVTLNSTIDIVVPVKKLNLNNVHRTPIIYSYPGGKGTNVARALRIINKKEKIIAIGFCGDKNFSYMKNFLKSFKINFDFVRVPGENRICILITEFKNKSETIINSESSFNIEKKHLDLFFKKLINFSKKSNFVVFSGSLPKKLPENFYEIVINKIKNFTKVVLDTSGKYLYHGIKSSPYILKQNILELSSAFNKNLEPFKNKKQFKNFIHNIADKYSLNIIITTLNENGVILYKDKNFFYFPNLKIKNILSPVGSGDAFTAGLIYGLEKKDIFEGIKYGMGTAFANLFHTGSCFFNRTDVYKYINKIKYKKF